MGTVGTMGTMGTMGNGRDNTWESARGDAREAATGGPGAASAAPAVPTVHTLPAWVSGWSACAGTDMREAARIVLGEADLPFVPLLPDRGVGSALLGRTLALLPSSFVVGPRTWRMAGATVSSRRTQDLVHRDLDICEDVWAGGALLPSTVLSGTDHVSAVSLNTANTANTVLPNTARAGESPRGEGLCEGLSPAGLAVQSHAQEQKAHTVRLVKVTVLGPWSMAAQTELSDGHLIVSDRRACAGLREEWIGAVGEHVADIQRRLGCQVLLHVVEPMVSQIIRGDVSGTSDFDVIAPIPGEVIGRAWTECADLLGQEFAKAADAPGAMAGLADMTVDCGGRWPVGVALPRWASPVVALDAVERALANGSGQAGRAFADVLGQAIDDRASRATVRPQRQAGSADRAPYAEASPSPLPTWGGHIVLRIDASAGSSAPDSSPVAWKYVPDDPARDAAIRVARVWEALGHDPQLLPRIVSVLDGHKRSANGAASEEYFSSADSLRTAAQIRDIIRADSGDL